jgi:hypothetical protein
LLRLSSHLRKELKIAANDVMVITFLTILPVFAGQKDKVFL